MNTKEELEAFRTKWKNELAQNSPSILSTAKQMYMRGVQLEREGYCYEAIEYFRQALKLAPDIEKHIDIRNDALSPSTSDQNLLGFQEDEEPVTEISTSGTGRQDPDGLDTSEMYFAGINACLPERNRSGLHVSVLPNEILLLVFRFVISTELDMKSIESIAGVCKWFYNLARTPQLWKAACIKIWPDVAEKPQAIKWREMFISKPHLRFDGVYVNRIKYHRLGEHRPNHCCTLQTVFYHRFLRFFSDGLVIGLTSTSPPQQVVPTLKDRSSTNKDVMYGKFTVLGDIVTLALYRRDKATRSSQIKLKPECSYNIKLQIVHKHGRQSLRWLEYYTIEKKNNVTTKSCIELEPPHFCKSYVFGRVKSYSAVSVGLI